MQTDLFKTFQNPPAAFRGKPFWAWNGKLEEGELRRQIRIMHRMGLGGFFMHSRVGLDTPYLSAEWFRLVGACVDEAGRLGLEAWLYDEDRWPSGAAGGLVTKNPKYRQRCLVMEILDNPRALRWTPDVAAVFTAITGANTLAGLTQIDSFKRLPGGAQPRLAAGEALLVFKVRLAPCSPWYNGYTYLDVLNPAAVRQFIKVTHAAYARHLQAACGKTVPGIFTDEPYFGNVLPKGKAEIPWTDRLPAAFRKRYGYDLITRLPELFLDVAGQAISPARYHYHDCVTALFVEAFARQVGAWCGRHRLLFTGHVLMEDTLSSQTSMVGSTMRFYEYMQAPGMDQLTEHRRDYDTAKQVSSAARQFGRRWRLTETYGCTGWDFPFAGHKALGDWQAALGINLRCPHLAWYTMRGQAKRDYPASIFYQSPWWEHYSVVEDYFARLHAAMTRGVEVRDLLVIHPVESMWTLCRMGWREAAEVKAYDRMLIELRDTFLTRQIDFDYGEEEILGRHARVVHRGGQALLRVAKAEYKAVVVPSLKTMRGSTLRLLRQFRQAGGLVVFAGPAAGYVDALADPAAATLAQKCVQTPAAGPRLAAAVEKVCRRISIADGHGHGIPSALYLLRADRDYSYLFICNTGHDPRRLTPGIPDVGARDRRAAFPDVRVRGFAGSAGRPLELDPATGARYAADAVRRNGEWEIRTSLPRLGSRLFLIPRRQTSTRLPRRPVFREVRREVLSRPSWTVALSEANPLVLDYAHYRVANGAWQEPQEILRIDRAIREQMKLAPRGGAMVQPWAQKADRNRRAAPVELAYKFEIETLPGGPLFLAIEDPQRYRIRVNNQELCQDMEYGWWVDRSLRKVPVDPACLRRGQNQIILSGNYHAGHPGLEIMYLLGPFGVRLKGSTPILIARPAALKIGDWCPQGLPFYSGSVTYQARVTPRLRRGERLFVQVPDYRGPAVRVQANGRTAGVIAWEPNEVDVTDCLAGPAMNLEIEILGHRRNSHGPLHHAQKWPAWTGPDQFVTRGPGMWIDSYQLVPCGLMAPPVLSVRKR